MKKIALSIIIGTALSINFSMALVPTIDKAQVTNSMKQLMEYVQQYKDQVDTWKTEAERYTNEITGISAKDVLGGMGVEQKGIENLFKDHFESVYKGVSPDQVMKDIASKGINGFPAEFKQKAMENYGSITAPKSKADIAKNKVTEYCGAKDATVLMLAELDKGAHTYRGAKTEKAREKTEKTVDGGKDSGGSMAGDKEKGGTVAVAAGTTASAVVAESNLSTVNRMVAEEKGRLETVLQKYELLCKEAIAEYSKTDSNTGFSTIINVLSIGLGNSSSGDSFEAKDPRFN